MLDGVKFACVLAARAGSKRLKNKNLAMCAGKPLWRYTKEAVEAAGMFDGAVITTDESSIQKLAVELGSAGWLLIGRPPTLATDDAHISDVMRWLVNKDDFPKTDYICLVSPTNPLRTGKHIRAAAELMLKEKADAVVSVAPCHPAIQSLMLDREKVAHTDLSIPCDTPTHHFDTTYRLTGSIVIAKTELWSRKASIYNDPNIKTVGYVMPKWDIDIDTKDDLFMAEAILQWQRKRRTSLKSSIKSVIRARSSKKSHE
jgi:CMP-N-acetylneuraminic acid synthetase